MQEIVHWLMKQIRQCKSLDDLHMIAETIQCHIGWCEPWTTSDNGYVDMLRAEWLGAKARISGPTNKPLRTSTSPCMELDSHGDL